MLEPRSRRPRSSPARLPEAVRSQALEVRAALERSGLDHGPISVHDKMASMGLKAPSPAWLARLFRDQGVARSEPSKRPRAAWRRFVYPAPNACWQLDATEYVLTGGRKCVIFQLIDDHSRYLLSITAAAAFSGTQVAEELSRLIAEYGPPASTLTDNGLVFTARLAGRKGGRNAFEKVLNANKIQQKNGRPGHPQTQGKIERFHQTLKKWINARPPAKAVAELQTLLNEFRDYYNTTRPHKALGRRTPHQAYTTGTKANPAHNPTQEWRTRNDVVWDNGKTTVRYAGKLFHLGIGRKWKKKENPHGHRRQPRHHITSRNRRSHHRTLHRHQPQLPKALLETRRPTPHPRIRRKPTPQNKRN